MIHRQQRYRAKRAAPRPHGFTLIELMVAMLLGLIVIAGVTSVFLAGQQSYRANEALGDVQDGSRIAFEMLARDLRGAGLTGCDTSSGRVANVLNSSTLWYADWNNALHGYDDASTDPALTGLTGAGAPVAGTSSVHVISTASTGVTVSWTPAPSSADFKISGTTTELNKGDLIMVCDFDHATILQITNYDNANVDVQHNSGSGVTPGNCVKDLGYPGPTPSTTCNGGGGNPYSFPGNSRVAKLTAVDWYIGVNPVGGGGRSLYRLNAVNSSGTVTATPEEMVRNVTNMQISYLQPPGTAFGTATGVTNWATVNAAQVTLTVQSTNQRASVNNAAPITRVFTSTTTVRNRVQ
ncbi:prepilin-type N-terminal cleavage/methylation domain-containing protein [Rhodanobacter sp. OK091]|uniref:prepilin-type N-terminal cleavage/methylation domain-containing protein n=1 Tax=Rhodanobacter sp. OK091 TaxID=1881037 RepID=UPI000934E414|nr:prepilin-type N-terminal cleavage/methylation domain-containing protein [Rhodanobacter sp. OK091]